MTAEVTVVELLDAVRIRTASLAEAKQRYAAELAPDFNLVTYLRNNEVALSRYLGLLLDTRGVHGQGELFLRGLLQRLPCSQGFEAQDLLRVELEKRTHNGRFLDICLVFRGGVIGIENKPWAVDQDKQLEDYARFLQSLAGDGQWLLLYACNREPADTSVPLAQREQWEQAGNYQRVDFSLLAEWLAESACHVRAAKVRLFVEALSEFVRQQVNGELDMTEAEQIKAVILQKPEHLEAALKVGLAIEQTKSQLLAEFKRQLGSALQEQGLSLVWDEQKMASQSLYAYFGAKFHPEHQVHLRFEFGADKLNTLEWGIRHDDLNTQVEPTKAELIANAMDEVFPGADHGTYWPWYISAGSQDPVLGDDERNWSTSAKPWLSISDKSEQGLVSRIVRLAVQVRQALSGVDAAMR